MVVDQQLLDGLTAQAKESARLRSIMMILSVWRAFPPGAIMASTVMPIGGKNCGMVCVLSVGGEML